MPLFLMNNPADDSKENDALPGFSLEVAAEEVLNGLFCHYEPPTSVRAQARAAKAVRESPKEYHHLLNNPKKKRGFFKKKKKTKPILKKQEQQQQPSTPKSVASGIQSVNSMGADSYKRKGVTWRDEQSRARNTNLENKVEDFAKQQCGGFFGFGKRHDGLADSLSPTAAVVGDDNTASTPSASKEKAVRPSSVLERELTHVLTEPSPPSILKPQQQQPQQSIDPFKKLREMNASSDPQQQLRVKQKVLYDDEGNPIHEDAVQDENAAPAVAANREMASKDGIACSSSAMSVVSTATAEFMANAMPNMSGNDNSSVTYYPEMFEPESYDKPPSARNVELRRNRTPPVRQGGTPRYAPNERRADNTDREATDNPKEWNTVEKVARASGEEYVVAQQIQSLQIDTPPTKTKIQQRKSTPIRSRDAAEYGDANHENDPYNDIAASRSHRRSPSGREHSYCYDNQLPSGNRVPSGVEEMNYRNRGRSPGRESHISALTDDFRGMDIRSRAASRSPLPVRGIPTRGDGIEIDLYQGRPRARSRSPGRYYEDVVDRPRADRTSAGRFYYENEQHDSREMDFEQGRQRDVAGYQRNSRSPHHRDYYEDAPRSYPDRSPTNEFNNDGGLVVHGQEPVPMPRQGNSHKRIFSRKRSKSPKRVKSMLKRLVRNTSSRGSIASDDRHMRYEETAKSYDRWNGVPEHAPQHSIDWQQSAVSAKDEQQDLKKATLKSKHGASLVNTFSTSSDSKSFQESSAPTQKVTNVRDSESRLSIEPEAGGVEPSSPETPLPPTPRRTEQPESTVIAAAAVDRVLEEMEVVPNGEVVHSKSGGSNGSNGGSKTSGRSSKASRSSRKNEKRTSKRSSTRKHESREARDRRRRKAKRGGPKSMATDDEIRDEVETIVSNTIEPIDEYPNPFLQRYSADDEEKSRLSSRPSREEKSRLSSRPSRSSLSASRSDEYAEPPASGPSAQSRHIAPPPHPSQDDYVTKQGASAGSSSKSSKSSKQSLTTKKLWRGWRKAIGKVQTIVRDIDENRVPNPVMSNGSR